MPPSKAKQTQVAIRRARHLELALSGKTNAEIAETLQAEGHAGLKSGKAASKDLCRMLDKAVKKEALNTEQYRRMNEQRLLALIAAVWPKATDGDLPAVEQTRKLIADLTKLFGLDMALKIEASGPGGGPIQMSDTSVHELHRLIGMAGEPDGADPDADDDSDAVYDGEAYEDEDEDADDDGTP